MIFTKPDIRANITLTKANFVTSGYRPAHLIGEHFTTGVHDYLDTETLNEGETTEGVITFISPEDYPHSLNVGMRLYFQEGSQTTGYADILEIYNKILIK